MIGTRIQEPNTERELNMPNSEIRINVDSADFDPWKVQEITHTLVDHPLLRLPSLVELGRRLESRKHVRTHNSDATAATSFANAPVLHPNRQSAESTLSQIAEAKAWMSLLFVHTDAHYRPLVQQIFEGLAAVVEPRDPGMCHRGAWIFVSSPGAVTPFHMDHVHTFILQIMGRKKYYTWDPFDEVVIPQETLEDFHGRYSREKVVWDESFRARAKVFTLEPGLGVYQPSTTPHMVENGDEPSVTLSISYYTSSMLHRERLFKGNLKLRELGISPKPIGSSRTRDAVKLAAFSGYDMVHTRVRRALGRGVRDNRVPYAPPVNY